MNNFRDDVTANVRAALKQRTPLLPCLQALSWVCRGSSLRYLPCFASSMLSTVWLYPTSTWILHDELRPPLVDLLRGLSDNSPNLRELSLTGFIMHEQTESVARDNLQQVASLRALSVLSIDLRFVICPNTVQVLSGMPHLRSLYFSSLSEDPPPSRAFTAARAGFDKLTCLTLAMSRGLTEMVLEALPPCGVTYVRMSTGPHGGVRHLARLFGPTLASLELACDVPAADAAEQMRAGVVAHLHLCGLTKVILGFPHAHAVTDSLCGEMAAAWPRLQSLKLRRFPRMVDDGWTAGMATLEGLVPFAQRCPELRELAINIDASGSHWGAVAVGPTRSRLCTLDLAQSTVTAPEAVAEFVLRVFPELASLSCNYRRPLGPNEDIEAMPENVSRRQMQKRVVALQRARKRVCEQPCFWYGEDRWA
ncbi:hypothetical protein DENSPDRAFT_844209 [Dentipellis sp. KUC8613]|nr:hypothetical protein DENSPDRAFT_844209 [Dentipellis sp. KUC8613]